MTFSFTYYIKFCQELIFKYVFVEKGSMILEKIKAGVVL